MTWWIHATNKESKSLVIHKTRQKPYLERKLSNHLSSLLFHPKVSSALLFHSKLPLFYSRLAFFLSKLSSATFSLFQNCQVCYFFVENYKLYYFHTKLFGFSLFRLILSCTLLLLPFFNSDGLATFPFKTVNFVTLIRSSLLLFTANDQARYFLSEIVEFATFFNLKVVKNIQFATFLSKTD